MFSPRNFRGIQLRVDSDLLSINNDSMFPGFNFVGESEMCRVVFDKVLEAFDIKERVVDTGDVESFGTLETGSEYESTYSS